MAKEAVDDAFSLSLNVDTDRPPNIQQYHSNQYNELLAYSQDEFRRLNETYYTSQLHPFVSVMEQLLKRDHSAVYMQLEHSQIQVLPLRNTPPFRLMEPADRTHFFYVNG